MPFALCSLHAWGIPTFNDLLKDFVSLSPHLAISSPLWAGSAFLGMNPINRVGLTPEFFPRCFPLNASS
jgi:hypothetical protein